MKPSVSLLAGRAFDVAKGLLRIALVLMTALGVVTPAAARDDAPTIWVDESRSIAGAKVIEVMPVTDESGTGIPAERLVEIQQAIQQVLDERTPGAAGGYRLSAEILSQDIKGTFDNTITLLVRYELGDPTGALVWSDNLYAQNEMSPKDVFSGEERKRQMQAAAMRSNLKSLIEQPARVLPVP
jgi:hypothetical protein